MLCYAVKNSSKHSKLFFFFDVLVSIRDLHQMKVKIEIETSIFNKKTFTNQMNLFTGKCFTSWLLCKECCYQDWLLVFRKPNHNVLMPRCFKRNCFNFFVFLNNIIKDTLFFCIKIL